MIIDTYTHVWSSLDQLGPEISQAYRTRLVKKIGQLDAGPPSHDRAMHCVDGSLVFGMRADRLGARVPNELVAEFVSREPRRRIGIAGIDPLSADAIDQIDSAVTLGLSGVMISPACQGFHPTHSAAMRVYERCTELSLPVFVTVLQPLTPNVMLQFARPVLLEEVAQAFPALPLVIGQVGYPWIDESLLMLAKHENIYSDISGVISRPWQLFNALLNATSLGVMDKLLFASGFPFDTPAKAIEAIYSVNSYSHGTQMPAVPRSLVRGIVEKDSLSCLGVETDLPIGRSPATDDEPATAEFVSMWGRKRPISGSGPLHH